MEKINFADKVYSLCKQIPKGKVSTYKEIADALGMKGYQAVGQVLKRNPYAPMVPCHRLVKSDGSVGGFKGCLHGKETIEKEMLLKKEGVGFRDGKVDLGKCLFKFT